MVNSFPAVLIGGPPHAGKSVLFYQITQALRTHRIPHYAIRACPDGEGDWFYEGDPETVSSIRRPTSEWPPAFVRRMCEDLEHRCLPFLVDVGGRPRPADIPLFRLCTHSILLLHADEVESTQLWQQMMKESHLCPLARLSSQQTGDSVITALSPVLEGIITGLERHVVNAGHGPVFDELVKQIVPLFNFSSPHDQKKAYLGQAPTKEVVVLEDALQPFTTSSTRWEPKMLLPFLANLPVQTPLSIYGRGPIWLYAALAAHVEQQQFYLFDTKLPFGWIQPAHVCIDREQSSEVSIELDLQSNSDFSVLKISFPNVRIEYFQPDPLAFPSLSTEKGLIIYGAVPNWLLTALVRLYKEAGVPWIAPFYVPLNKAVVAYSRIERYQPGDLVSVLR
jgi:CRISPR-associated protein Csx3